MSRRTLPGALDPEAWAPTRAAAAPVRFRSVRGAGWITVPDRLGGGTRNRACFAPGRDRHARREWLRLLSLAVRIGECGGAEAPDSAAGLRTPDRLPRRRRARAFQLPGTIADILPARPASKHRVRPIWTAPACSCLPRQFLERVGDLGQPVAAQLERSEERRVGKEWRSRWA